MKLAPQELRCDLCVEEECDEEEQGIAIKHCYQCNKNLCYSHLDIHNRKKINKDHQLNDLGKKSEMVLLQTFVPEHHVCPKHPSNVLKVLCKPCKVLICGECSCLPPHDNHEKVHVSQIIEKERKETLDLIMELKDKVNNMNERKEKVELTIDNVNKRLQQITKEIDDNCNEIITAVEERRKELMKKAQLIHDERETKLKNESLQLNNLMQNVDKQCQSILKGNQSTGTNQINRQELEQKLKETSDIDVILNKLSLEKGKQNINEMQQSNELQSFPEFELIIQKDKEQIINLIKSQLGDVVDYSIDVDKCYITNFNEIKQGVPINKKNVKINLQLMNKKNEKVTKNYNNYKVTAFLSTSKEVLIIDDSRIELKSINNNNGTLGFKLSDNLLKFERDLPYLHILINDKSIKDFPFQLNIIRCLFDSNYCGKKGQLLNDNKRFKRGDSNGWNCGVLGINGCFRYKIKLLNNCQNLMVGFALKTTFNKNSNNYDKNGGGWYLYCNSGTLYSGNVNYSGEAYLNKSCNSNGTIIEAIFTPETKSISFIVDGTNYGNAFENINVTNLNDLCPAFNAFSSGCEFEFIN
ncbi:hypothetical protein ABK040_008719 [Willaertia magna]